MEADPGPGFDSVEYKHLNQLAFVPPLQACTRVCHRNPTLELMHKPQPGGMCRQVRPSPHCQSPAQRVRAESLACVWLLGLPFLKGSPPIQHIRTLNGGHEASMVQASTSCCAKENEGSRCLEGNQPAQTSFLRNPHIGVINSGIEF